MTVKQIPVNIICLEYRQDRNDKDYGSCLYARFYFNLDKYELSIVSDVGNYSYKWTETPDSESFLELMERVSEYYLRHKLCGDPQEFDYEATKDHMYEYWYEEPDKKVLDRIFEELEYEDGVQNSADIFLMKFDENNYEDDNIHHAYFSDVWEMLQYSYTAWQEKICKIFIDIIQPKIKEILENGKNIELDKR